MHQSKMPHTPGPWGFTYDGSSDWSIGPADDPQARRIASVWDRDDARAEANVRLIAAAPELLAALKLLARGNGQLCFCEMAIGNPMLKEHSRACVNARAAIQKAEGQ